MAHPSRFIVASLLAVTTLSFSNCGSPPKEEETQAAPSSPSEAIASAARERQIDERVLLSAAYVESNFGKDTDFNRATSDQVKRTPLFGMQGSDAVDVKPEDVLANARALASKMSDLSKSLPPTDAVDWLLITAQAVVGNMEHEPARVRDAALRIVFTELVQVYNSGFFTVVGDQIVKVAAQPEDKKIVINPRDRRKLSQFVSDEYYRSDNTQGVFLGNVDAQTRERAKSETPRIILRWCPASTLKCFEHLRRTTKSPAHYLSFRGLNGDRHFLKLHPNAKDLRWYDEELDNAITIVFSGLAGNTPETLRPDWFDWEDYVAVKRTIDAIVTDLRGTNEAIGDKSELMMRKTIESGLPAFFEGQVALPKTPDGEPDFALPLAWDRDLFRKLLPMNPDPHDQSSIIVETPETGQTYNGTSVTITVHPDIGTANLQIFKDSGNAFSVEGKPVATKLWDQHTLANEEADGRTWEKTFEFRLPGASRNKVRALKIVCTDAKGNLLSSRIVRFIVDGIQVR